MLPKERTLVANGGSYNAFYILHDQRSF